MSAPAETVKQCQTCGRTLSVTEYTRVGSCKSGHKHWRLDCDRCRGVEHERTPAERAEAAYWERNGNPADLLAELTRPTESIPRYPRHLAARNLADLAAALAPDDGLVADLYRAG